MDKPAYYAVITADVRYADIPPNAKLLYGEISALCNKEGYCWASNQYFAELYKVHHKTVSDWVSVLAQNGFIGLSTGPNNERLIRLTPHREKTEGVPQNHGTPHREITAPPTVKSRHRIIHSNTTLNTSEAWASQGDTPRQKIKEGDPEMAAFIVEIIDLWAETFDDKEMTKTWYANKVQRNAIESLRIRFKHDDNHLRSMIGKLPEIMCMPYMPKMSTPYMLNVNLADILAKYKQQVEITQKAKDKNPVFRG